ncbi:MAG TPA: hypothetical protein VJS44_08020 [Pyrinomonadaceae bacterium]|nr:hypothetical protein [Pyrinomonadaceae bacterium]
MTSPLSKSLETFAGLLAVVALIVLVSTDARGQVTSMTPLPAPPPLRLVAREDRSQLDAAKDAKGRTKLTIQLAEARLERAEQMTSAQQFEEAARELGFYQGLLDDAMRFLKSEKNQKKLRDTYKRFEIALRSHAMRLETMRRGTPSEYSVNIKSITDYTKDVRGEALNGFFGDAVITDAPDEDGKAPEESNATASPQSPSKERP